MKSEILQLTNTYTLTHTAWHRWMPTWSCLRPLDNHLAALWIQSLSSLGQEQVRSQIGWVMLCESFHPSKPHFPGCKLRGLNEVVPKVHYNSNNSYNHSHWIEPSEVNHDCHTAPKDWLIPLFCLWLIKHPSFIIHPSILHSANSLRNYYMPSTTLGILIRSLPLKSSIIILYPSVWHCSF